MVGVYLHVMLCVQMIVHEETLQPTRRIDTTYLVTDSKSMFTACNCAGEEVYPGFLTDSWFPADNAVHMRGRICISVSELAKQQATVSFVDKPVIEMLQNIAKDR